MVKWACCCSPFPSVDGRMTQLEQNTLGTSGKERPGADWGQGQERRRWVGKKLTPDEELGARPLHLAPLPQTLWSQLASPGPGPVDSQLCSCLSPVLALSGAVEGGGGGESLPLKTAQLRLPGPPSFQLDLELVEEREEKSHGISSHLLLRWHFFFFFFFLAVLHAMPGVEPNPPCSGSAES